MIYKPKFRNCAKRCYELSIQTVLNYEENKGCAVIYGKVTNVKLGFTYQHAWVMKDDQVYDPVMDLEMTWDEYKARFDAKIFRKFSEEEVRALVHSNKMYGIFDEIVFEYDHFMRKDNVFQCPVCEVNFKPYEFAAPTDNVIPICPNKCQTNGTFKVTR